MAVVALAACALVAASGRPPAARGQTTPGCASPHWVAAWSADPSGILPGGIADETLRIVLTPHVGADQLRIHLSNRFGASPVRFARATVALRRAGAALVPGSTRPLTFAGAAAVSVPAGGEVVSDPAPLSFDAFADLAVSLDVAGSSGPATGHLVGRQRSYATATSSGDHTADAAAGAFGASTTSVSFLDAVDALVPGGVGAAVLFGDSLVDGYESVGLSGGEDLAGIDANHRLPDYLARRLLAQPGGPRLSVVNAGISGNRLLADAQQTMAGESGLSRLGRDVLGVAGVSDAIVLEGTNDIGGLASADRLKAALVEVVTRLQAAGIHVLLGTIVPAGTGLLGLGNVLPSVYVDSPTNAVRVALNAWIRSGASGADQVVDFDAALRGTAQPNVLDPALDSGDHVHPNYAGYARMADAVDVTRLRGTACAPAPPRAATELRVRARAQAAGRLRVTGTVRTARPAACTGGAVVVRALHSARTVLERRLRMSIRCRVAGTLRIGARGRIEIRVSFGGSATLLPARARSIFLRAP